MRTSLKRRAHGYTFAEVLVASAILGLAIGAGVKLIATMMIQEETSYHQAVAMNLQDNAARAWQLGLSPAEVTAILPSTTDNSNLANCLVPSGTNAVSFGTAGTTTLANTMGTLENISCSITLSFINSNTRTNTVQVYRPSIR